MSGAELQREMHLVQRLLFLDPLVAYNTNDSDFSIAQLNSLPEPVSLYLVVPPSDQERLKPLFRLLLSQNNQTLTREVETHRPAPRQAGWWPRTQVLGATFDLTFLPR